MNKVGSEQDALPHKKWSRRGGPTANIRRWEMFLLGMVVGGLLLATVQAYTGKELPPRLQANQPAERECNL